MVLGVLVVIWMVAILGRSPQGIPALLAKRQQIRQFEEENATLRAKIERERQHIQRLQTSQSEQEVQIRSLLKMQKPGDRTFILPKDEQSSPAK